MGMYCGKAQNSIIQLYCIWSLSSFSANLKLHKVKFDVILKLYIYLYRFNRNSVVAVVVVVFLLQQIKMVE